MFNSLVSNHHVRVRGSREPRGRGYIYRTPPSSQQSDQDEASGKTSPVTCCYPAGEEGPELPTFHCYLPSLDLASRSHWTSDTVGLVTLLHFYRTTTYFSCVCLYIRDRYLECILCCCAPFLVLVVETIVFHKGRNTEDLFLVLIVRSSVPCYWRVAFSGSCFFECVVCARINIFKEAFLVFIVPLDRY